MADGLPMVLAYAWRAICDEHNRERINAAAKAALASGEYHVPIMQRCEALPSMHWLQMGEHLARYLDECDQHDQATLVRAYVLAFGGRI